MNALQQLEAVHARHIDVTQQHIDVAFFQLAQRRFAIGATCTIAEPLQLFLRTRRRLASSSAITPRVALFVHC
jgi:hypothetical protein